MQTLNQDIKEKSFKKIYLLYGDEPFLVGSYKREAAGGHHRRRYHELQLF